MKLLCIILTVMSWVVESKNSVSCQGTPPESCSAHYSCSYQKGTVCAGDVATLQLTSLGGITIEGVEVYMRSNKSAGAGVLTLKVNGQTVVTKSGTFKDWTGSYDNENFHAISLLSTAVAGAQEMEIRLEGMENSLYIEKYVITYTPVAPRTVTLFYGAREWGQLTEAQGGAGVVLPLVSDTANWYFAGWSDSDFGSSTSKSHTLYAAGERFYPSADCSLWAVFAWQPLKEKGYLIDLQSGTYLYVNSASNQALSGVPLEGKMAAADVDDKDLNQHYYVHFTDAQTAYITHVATGTPIGYSGTEMAPTASAWQVYHEGDQTLFYMTYENKTYVLWLNIQYNTDETSTYAGLLPATLGTSPMHLQYVQTTGENYYTCHPEWAQGMDRTAEDQSGVQDKARFLMHLGQYDLLLINGQKMIHQR